PGATVDGPGSRVTMQSTLRAKLDALVERFEEIGLELSDPAVVGDQEHFRKLSQEYARLQELTALFNRYREFEPEIEGLEALTGDRDPDMRALAEDELPAAREKLADMERELKKFLTPRDPHDDANTLLEIRAGTGGDEAA